MEALGVQKHPVHGALKIELLWWLRGYWNKVSSFGGGRGGVAEENQVYLEATVRQIFAQQMDKLFVLAALPPWPLLLGLAISFRVYAPVAHSVPPWPLLLGFLAVLNSFQSLRCMHSFQRSVFWVSGLPSIVS